MRSITLRYILGPVAAVMVLLAGVLTVRSDARRYVWFQFTPHIGAPDATSPVAPFPANDPPPVRLAAAGDVGTGGADERATASTMDHLENELEFDALLLLGDNVYPDGDPSHVQEAVFDPFAGVLDDGTKLLPVLGNHDVHNGNGDAQAAALGMPARWYATTIDDVLVISLDSTRADDPAQLAWLERTLAESASTWRIATMHHPPYSGGYHGSSIAVRKAFTPLFEQYGVQLVLAGHDHDYQRSEVIDGVTYVVTGGAAKLRPTNRDDFTAVAWSTHNFVDIAIWPDRLQLRAIDQTGAMFDSIVLLAAA